MSITTTSRREAIRNLVWTADGFEEDFFRKLGLNSTLWSSILDPEKRRKCKYVWYTEKLGLLYLTHVSGVSVLIGLT